MDFTWIILLAIIAIISSVMTKKSEVEAKKRQQQKTRSQGGSPPGGREPDAIPRRSVPRSPGPPVAPGPFGMPTQTPRRTAQPREQAPVSGELKPIQDRQREATTPTEPTSRDGDIFGQMRTRLDEAKRQHEQTSPRQGDGSRSESAEARKRVEPVERQQPTTEGRERTKQVARDASAPLDVAPRDTVQRRATRSGGAEKPYVMGTQVRAAGEQEPEPVKSGQARKVRARTLSVSGPDLRRAIILKEVLGPPKALQSDREVWESN
mgnify:CR=1 FL=1|jgi:hypothetical protein